ncbi:MAG: hypothetical protein KJ574_02495 [Nanoarchaeota archaeon]|nr:hypothetical protein [Nanoarchaeota archaeon]
MTVYIIENGCPLCGGEARGNEQYKYYCKVCNILFDRKALAKEKRKEVPKKEEKEAEKELKQINAELKSEIKEELEAETPTYAEEGYSAQAEETEEVREEKEAEKERKFIASAKSDKMHVDTCHFLRKIQKENWIHLDSLQDGIKKGYVPCVCIRRKGLMKI